MFDNSEKDIKENKRILIVDDNPSIHKDFTRILIPESENKKSAIKISKASNLFDSFMDTEAEPEYLDLDYEVNFALQGQEALIMIEEAIKNEKPYSLVFMDIRMPPGWDGIKTLVEIFKIDNNLQAVICSAYSDYSYFDLKDRFGSTERILFLKKPFDTHEVLQLSASLTKKWNLAKDYKVNYLRLENELKYREKIENQLVQAQKMESIGQLAGGLAHDFNNILSGIVGVASMNELAFKSRNIDMEKLKRFNNLIIKATERATTLTDQLFALSRKNKFVLLPFDLNKSINDTIEICNNTFDKKVELIFADKDKKTIINGDKNQIEQVILNLSINAAHAMTIMRKDSENQGGTLTYLIEEVEADKFFIKDHDKAKTGFYWKLNIKDTGVGIDSETLPKIFDPFFTTKEQSSGTGLGLSMVYNIIERHDGFIKVYSEENIGTDFNIYFPVIKEKMLDDEKEDIKEESFSGTGTILIIDDDETVLDISKQILEQSGFTVLTAINGKEGVDIYSKNYSNICLVILDVVMPVLSGKETYIKLKEINKDVKVLLASGFAENERIKKIMNLGVKSFIQKPFTLNQLLKAIKNLLKEN